MGSNDVRAPLAPAPGFLDLRTSGADPADELRASLAADAPFIAPKFFYDALGSRLFEAICELPEYPLTRAERRIFERHGDEIAARAGIDRPLVDLGAGNCEKAEQLFAVLAPSKYVAVDIAADFLRERLAALALRHPGQAMVGLAQDFSAALDLPAMVQPGPRTVFYPGSSIGNFAPPAALEFLARAREACGPGGCLVLGADLVRDKRALDLAYDDPLGVTAAFNLNVLRNASRCVDADFDVADWRHVAFFDPVTSRIEMHVEARCDVAVRWSGGGRRFRATDRIHTENSYKYTLPGLRALLRRAGFGDAKLWTDDEASFAVAVAAA
ncbi:MAG: L-histidine N(alpha)-methyltransferase [Betaproteobacteria bacterium]